ncbi:protein of uncharacterised function DUF222/HNH endonuclease [Mycolicibacterium aurum]|uniref:Protein of uncharacterized function DUF222/HNH endonuclease n=1 Tax=Mycolicibacterium aurum TaxID=1791 RepID=A0A448IHW5_MYCAU|nr:HNH endonuclease signature motif containing protein [Mycolicibacterium aurum]VEG52095.1 protein of uncharacterised function DUF222/HNH endonuclease [Mycolicibacterium aurum]
MFDQSVPEPSQLDGLSAAELVDAARACARAENAACARKLAVMAEIFVRRTRLPAADRENWWVDPDAAVSAELAAAQHITSGLALHQTHRGVALRDRLPHVADLFLRGLISDTLVRIIVTRTYLITDPDLVAAVDADLAAEITSWGPMSQKKTVTAIDALVERHDPNGLRITCDSAATRDVQFGSPTDAPGYTSVWARMLASDAATAERVLTELVYSVCDDDPRTVTERRNDAYAALLAGIPALACRCGAGDCEAAARPRPRRDTTVYVITDATTPPSAQAADEPSPETVAAPAPRSTKPFAACTRPAFVFGAGLTPAPLLGELVSDVESTHIRDIIHPGQSGPEPRYTPSRALADFIRCRDLTCRFPWCDKPATSADIDHTVPYPVGPTHPSNLKCLCRFHHLLKTFWIGALGWRDRQYPDGTIIWTSPTGHTYTTYPGSRLLFPALCRPTATLWVGDPPDIPLSDRRGTMMPRRRHTRAYNRARAIAAERQRNEVAGDHPPPF